jgi:uncharacterized delta-60 repeat protein
MKTSKAPTTAARGGRLAIGSKILLLVLGIHLAGFTAGVMAAPGDLDTNFGTDGVAIAMIGTDDRIKDLVMQPDGKIVAVGSTAPNAPGLKESAVARFNPDGTLDPTFAFGGKAVFGFGSYHDEARSAALQADGKIVIAGYANNDSSWGQIYVARLNQNGTLDDTFGQNGVTRLDRRQTGTTSEAAYAVGIQPSGKILVVGTSSSGSWPTYSALARLDENGVLDTAFGKIHTENRTPRSLFVYPDGKFLVAGGYDFFGGPRRHWLGRYGVNGNLESDNLIDVGGTNGGYAECVTVDSEGGVWTSGSRYNNPNYELVLRDEGGMTIGPIGEGGEMAFQPNGKLIVIGGDFICRYNPDRNLDPTFANGGIMSRPSEVWQPKEIVCQGNGSILIGGQSSLGYFSIARVLADGNPPTDISAIPAEIAENLPAGTPVASVTTTDLDPDDTFEYSLVPGEGDSHNAAFSITGNQIVSASVLDFEAGETRSIRVRVVDSGESIFEKIITITILDDLSEDIDEDGLNQEQEKFYGTSDFSTDSDGDGLHDYTEIHVHNSNPASDDTDGDGLEDPDELAMGTGISNQDSDGDGLIDGQEIVRRALPLNPDTDGDGFLDGYEVQTGKSPTDPLDKPALVAEARTAIEFSFPSALGKTYRIEDSPDMESWGPVESGIAGNGGTITRFYSTRNREKRFFRVEEQTGQ